MKKYIYSLAAASSALLLFSGVASADTVSVNFETPTYTVGNINGQDGWSKTGSFDVAVTTNTYSIPSFGGQTLRLSDAVTSGSFGDQAFSKSLINEAGEAVAENGGMSGGARQSHFEAQFDLASTMATQQTGMHMTVSPDRGDGARMSYLRFEDQSDGIHVFFDDVTNPTHVVNAESFNETDIATLTRAAHTIKFSMDFVAGADNDVVKIYIDGVLKITGTSWEDYYRFDTESNPLAPTDTSRTVDSLLFRESGSADTGNLANGFLVDNLSLLSGPTPAPQVHIFKNVDGVQATAANANSASFPMVTSWVSSGPNGTVNDVPFTLSPSGWGVTDAPYEASYVGGVAGDNYAAHEVNGGAVVGASCADNKPFALAGYSTGDTLSQAQTAGPSATLPSFTNLQTDKYIIVWNVKCQPHVHVTIAKYVDGVHATALNANGESFSLQATYNFTNEAFPGGVSGSDAYAIGPVGNGTPTAYEAQTLNFFPGATYSTSENMSSNVGANCSEGKEFSLAGYSVGADEAAAQAAPISMTAPTFANLQSNQFVIVRNQTCTSVPTITSPANNSCVTSANQLLIDWTNSTGVAPIVYQYQAYSDANYSVLVYDSGPSLTSSQIPTPGTPPGTYYIRVRAQGGNGSISTWSNGASNPYKIVVSANTLTWSSLLSPLNISGKTFNTGSTIPVKVQITNACGVSVNPGLPTLSITGPNSSTQVSSGPFRFDTSAGQYIFNWSTKSPVSLGIGSYNIVVGQGTTGISGAPTATAILVK